jgi:hypothetical protein
MEPPPESDLPPPTRDELVEAWGDHVLAQLRPRVRAVFAVGRFLATEGATAILALPNSTHVDRAKEHSEEVAEALGRYFGRPVHLRLVAETDVGAAHLPSTSAVGGTRGVSQADPDAYGSPAPARLRATGAPGAVPTPGTAGAGGSGGTDRSASFSSDPSRAIAVSRTAMSHDPDDAGEELLDPDDLDPLGEHVPGDAVSWAQERLMEVFPGAEEV